MNVSSAFRRTILGAALALAALAPAALAGPAQAAAAPTLSPVQIKPAGTSAAVAFTSAEPVAVTIGYQATAPTASLPTVRAWDTYTTTHATTLTGLSSDTTYAVTVTARALDGRTATARASFTTLKKRVRITLESIDITDDGDGFLTGDGEPRWEVYTLWDGGNVRGCYPLHCGDDGSIGEGRITPSNSAGETLRFDFAEENFDRFPDALALGVIAQEDDGGGFVEGVQLPRVWDCVANGGCTAGEDSPTVWRVPQDEETAYQTLKVAGVENRTGFRSVLNFAVVLFHNDTPYPAPKRNVPFSNWK